MKFVATQVTVVASAVALPDYRPMNMPVNFELQPAPPGEYVVVAV